MSMYLLPVMGGAEERSDSVFSYASCDHCGASVRVQSGDLKLRAIQQFELFTTTLDGDFLVASELAETVARLEPSIQLRPAGIENVDGEWFQVLPSRCVELEGDSLRSPREPCDTCGGVARVQFASFPPLRVARSQADSPHIASICGAPQMTVISMEFFDVLSELDPGFDADEVLFASVPGETKLTK